MVTSCNERKNETRDDALQLRNASPTQRLWNQSILFNAESLLLGFLKSSGNGIKRPEEHGAAFGIQGSHSSGHYHSTFEGGTVLYK
jgi:hypothetical protein